MTPAGQRWTRERPTEPGWYWFRNSDGLQMLVVIYGPSNHLEVNCQGDTELEHYHGEFQGPLSPNEVTE